MEEKQMPESRLYLRRGLPYKYLKKLNARAEISKAVTGSEMRVQMTHMPSKLALSSIAQSAS